MGEEDLHKETRDFIGAAVTVVAWKGWIPLNDATVEIGSAREVWSPKIDVGS